jgi:hypothetical protein
MHTTMQVLFWSLGCSCKRKHQRAGMRAISHENTKHGRLGTAVINSAAAGSQHSVHPCATVQQQQQPCLIVAAAAMLQAT